MTNTTLFQTWYEEVWNKGNENFIIEALHPDAVIHGLQVCRTMKNHRPTAI